jgi:hypothetical protein
VPPAAFSHCGTDLYVPSIHSYASLHVQRSLSVSTPAIKPSRLSSYHQRPWVDQVHVWPVSFRLELEAKLTTKTIHITGTKSTACCYNMSQEDLKQQNNENAVCRVQRNTLISERDSLLAASREDTIDPRAGLCEQAGCQPRRSFEEIVIGQTADDRPAFGNTTISETTINRTASGETAAGPADMKRRTGLLDVRVWPISATP